MKRQLYQARSELEAYGGSISLLQNEQTIFRIALPRNHVGLSLPWKPTILVLTSDKEVVSHFSKIESSQVEIYESIEEALISIKTMGSVQLSIVVELAYESGESSAFDLLDIVREREESHLVLFSPIVDNPEIQKIADYYGALLVEKWRLLNAIKK